MKMGPEQLQFGLGTGKRTTGVNTEAALAAPVPVFIWQGGQ